MDFPNLYNDPILYNKRKNTYDDPYMSYDETHSILNGRIFLTENPNRENRVVVSGGNTEWKEIEDGELEDDCYRVDYMMGVVFLMPLTKEKNCKLNTLAKVLTSSLQHVFGLNVQVIQSLRHFKD